MEEFNNLVSKSEGTTNGDDFINNELLVGLFDEITAGIGAYNMVVRRRPEEQAHYLELFSKYFHEKLGYEEKPGISPLDNLLNALVGSDIHAASYFYWDGKIHIGPNIGTRDAKYSTHTEISKKVLPAAPITSDVQSGYCLFKKFKLGDYEIDGIFSCDQDIAIGQNLKSVIYPITVPEVSSHPLVLVEVVDEHGDFHLMLYISSEHKKYLFKKPAH